MKVQVTQNSSENSRFASSYDFLSLKCDQAESFVKKRPNDGSHFFI